jgi:hypothetical protein
MPCNRIGGHYLALRNKVGGRRRTSVAMAMSVAISATILLLIDSSIIARAATIEEVARCRAIQINKERWDCFKALKAPKQNAPNAKRDDTPRSQTETVPKMKMETVAKTKGEDVPKAKSEDVPKAKSEDVPKAKTEDVPKAKTEEEDVPKTKSEDAPPGALTGVQETAPDDPASTSSIDHLGVAPGQPVCVDQDSLAAAFVAAVVLGSTRYGCQTIPKDATIEILQRLPSGFQFLRAVRVKVTSPLRPGATVGYTFEISR